MQQPFLPLPLFRFALLNDPKEKNKKVKSRDKKDSFHYSALVENKEKFLWCNKEREVSITHSRDSSPLIPLAQTNHYWRQPGKKILSLSSLSCRSDKITIPPLKETVWPAMDLSMWETRRIMNVWVHSQLVRTPKNQCQSLVSILFVSNPSFGINFLSCWSSDARSHFLWCCFDWLRHSLVYVYLHYFFSFLLSL